MPVQCGAVVNFTLPDQTDNCSVSNVVATPVSGSFFEVGTTPVTVVVTDLHGNSNTNTFNVTVNDTEPPSGMCRRMWYRRMMPVSVARWSTLPCQPKPTTAG